MNNSDKFEVGDLLWSPVDTWLVVVVDPKIKWWNIKHNLLGEDKQAPLLISDVFARLDRCKLFRDGKVLYEKRTPI